MTAATPTISKIPDQCAPSATSRRPANGVNNNQLFKVHYLEAGSSGPVVSLYIPAYRARASGGG